MNAILTYGGVPVPWTASWTAEEAFHVARCPTAGGRVAICQSVAQGEGKPRFGKPHSQRQRKAIADGLCDLCGRTLKGRTKVSLSHARPRYAAEGWAILQVEPLLHKECAAESIEHCPSLKRDLRDGSLMVRQVARHRVQFAVMHATYTQEIAGAPVTAIGHAKVELLSWTDRTEAWLQ
jgi:hypothetical protein